MNKVMDIINILVVCLDVYQGMSTEYTNTDLIILIENNTNIK